MSPPAVWLTRWSTVLSIRLPVETLPSACSIVSIGPYRTPETLRFAQVNKRTLITMANINNVDIMALKNGEVNLGVSLALWIVI